MAYYNPHSTGQYNPLYTLNAPFFFIAQLDIGRAPKGKKHRWNQPPS